MFVCDCCVCVEVDLRRDLAGNFQDKSMTHRFNAFSFFLNNKKKDEFLSVVNLGIFPNIFFTMNFLTLVHSL